MPLNYPNIDALIAQFEGFGTEGVPATVNNNPGNIIAGTFASKHGATGVNGPFAVFPDVETGALAQDALVSSYASKGLTIEQLLNKWAPGTAPGNTPAGTQSYVDFVSGQLGVPATTPIIAAEKKTPDALPTGGQSQSSWSKAIQAIEGALLPDSVTAAQKAQADADAARFNQKPAISFSRIGAFVLGLILIAGGLFLFKPTQNIITTGATLA